MSPDGVECKRAEVSNNVQVVNGSKEVWEYDYVKEAKPKFVRDRAGNRIKYNPNVHM